MSKLEKRFLFCLLMFVINFILVLIIDKIFYDKTFVGCLFIFLIFIVDSILQKLYDKFIEKRS